MGLEISFFDAPFGLLELFESSPLGLDIGKPIVSLLSGIRYAPLEISGGFP